MKGPSALLAILLLVSSGATAAPMRANLVVAGHVGFKDGVSLDGQPLAAFLQELDGVTRFDGTFPTLTVTTAEEKFFDVNGVRLGIPATEQRGTATYRDVRLEGWFAGPAGDPSNFTNLGFYPLLGGALRADLSGGAAVKASLPQTYGSTGTENHEDPSFYQSDVDEPHVASKAPGNFTYSGNGKVIVNGLDLEIQHRDGTIRIATGEVSSATPGVKEVTETWVHLDFPQGNLALETRTPFEVAFRDAAISWSGSASTVPESGEVDVDGTSTAHPGRRVELAGDLAGWATATMEGSAPRLLLDVAGTPATSSLTANRALPAGGGSILPVVVLLAVAAGTGGAAAWLMRRRSQAQLDPDELLTLAHLAGEGGRHDEALGWIRRARALASESGTLALEEAFHLGELGLVDEALAAYREAARMLDDGQAEMDAALLGLASGALPRAEVEALLAAALTKSPALVLELEDHRTLRALLVVGPELSAAMRAARRSLGEP